MSCAREHFKTRDVEHPELDVTPVEVPVEMGRPPSLKEELQRYARYEIHRVLTKDEPMESFEEADNFDVGDDDEETAFLSDYQVLELESETDETLDGSDDPNGGSVGEERPEAQAEDVLQPQSEPPQSD